MPTIPLSRSSLARSLNLPEEEWPAVLTAGEAAQGHPQDRTRNEQDCPVRILRIPHGDPGPYACQLNTLITVTAATARLPPGHILHRAPPQAGTRRIASRNVAGRTRRNGPSGSFESRTATSPSVLANSTQLPPSLPLKLDLRQVSGRFILSTSLQSCG